MPDAPGSAWFPSAAGLLGGGSLAEGEMPAAPPDLTRIGSPAGTLRTASACCSTAGRSSARSPQPGYKSRAARSDRDLGTVDRGRRPGPLSEKPARNQQLRGIRGKSYIKHKPCIMFYLPASSPKTKWHWALTHQKDEQRWRVPLSERKHSGLLVALLGFLL